jgi:DnaJ-class molecular chaperone
MSQERLSASYTILEIAESAAEHEIKSAYKRLALKHHPGIYFILNFNKTFKPF